jgi:hypothetical protein
MAIFIHCHALAVDEFLLEGLESLIVEMELHLERPIRHPLALTEKVDNLIKDSVKVHRAPSCTVGGDAGPHAAHGQEKTGFDIPQRARKKKPIPPDFVIDQ